MRSGQNLSAPRYIFVDYLQIIKQMNHKLLIIAVILFIGYQGYSQTWPMLGAKWTYCLTGWNGMPAGEETFEITGDTLIAGNLYNIISPVDVGIDNYMKNETESRRLFTRYVNDTIYRFVNNQEYLFFTFNLSIDDVFSTYRTAGWNYNWEDSACSSILPLRVIEENVVELNGQVLKKFVLEDTLFEHLYDPNYPDPVTYTLIERIGVINTYHFINTIEPPENCSLPSDWGLAELGYYTDIDFGYLFEECQGVGVYSNKKHNSEISIFPNPTKSFIEVVQTRNALGKYKISLLNNLGQVIHATEMKSEKHRIDLSNYQNGYYFLILTPDKYSLSIYTFPVIIYH